MRLVKSYISECNVKSKFNYIKAVRAVYVVSSYDSFIHKRFDVSHKGLKGFLFEVAF